MTNPTPTPGDPERTELTLAVRQALTRREPEALELFYEAWFDRLYAFVRRMVGEEHLAEDVTQDVFLRIHEALPSYDPARPLRPWVLTIAANKVRDLWRSRRHREQRREASLDDGPADAQRETRLRSPRAELENRELGAALTRAIEKLPDSMRSTLLLRYFEGLSFEAIGRIVDRNEAAVRKRYSRALETLRRELAPTVEPCGGAGGNET